MQRKTSAYVERQIAFMIQVFFEVMTSVALSANSFKLLTVSVGSIPQGTKTVSGERLTHADFMPAEIAPITSKGLLEISQALLPVAPDWRKK